LKCYTLVLILKQPLPNPAALIGCSGVPNCNVSNQPLFKLPKALFLNMRTLPSTSKVPVLSLALPLLNALIKQPCPNVLTVPLIIFTSLKLLTA